MPRLVLYNILLMFCLVNLCFAQNDSSKLTSEGDSSFQSNITTASASGSDSVESIGSTIAATPPDNHSVEPPPVNTTPAERDLQSLIATAPKGISLLEFINELPDAGINKNDLLTRDPSNFADGNFKILTTLTNALNSDKLLKKYPAFRDNIKKFIIKHNELSFPWTVTGIARRIYKRDKYLAELSCSKNEPTEISQNIIFKNKNASIDFDAYIIAADKQDELEVILRDSSGSEFVTGAYKLSRLPSTTHISVDISKKDWFLKRYQPVKLPENNADESIGGLYQTAGFTVAFRLKCNGLGKTILQLDNFKVIYP